MCFIFVIISRVFLTIAAEKKSNLYYSLSIGVIGLYLIFIVYLVDENGITLSFVIQHMSALLVLGCGYLYEDKEKSKRNKILSKLTTGFIILFMLSMFTRSWKRKFFCVIWMEDTLMHYFLPEFECMICVIIIHSYPWFHWLSSRSLFILKKEKKSYIQIVEHQGFQGPVFECRPKGREIMKAEKDVQLTEYKSSLSWR